MVVLSERSMKALSGVHPKLVEVVERAAANAGADFTVIEGLRTLEKQKEYFDRGASKTMKSKHLKQPDGFGHAVDIYPFYDGKVQVNAPMSKFREIANCLKQAADEVGAKIVWGGDWKTFVDAPHYQLEA